MGRIGLVVLLGLSALSACGGHHEAAAPPVPQSSVVGRTSDGWQVVRYADVRVDVPPGWTALNTSACDFSIEHYGPRGLDPCSPDAGLWFFASATFDPAVGPGVHSLPASRDLPDGGWGGYADQGDHVVDVGDADRATVARILGSVRPR